MADKWPSAFDAFVKVHPEEVLDELTVVTPKQLGRNFLLHMSKDSRLREMIPYVSTRTVRHENRSVARICVGSTIAACILGYGGAMIDFLEGSDTSDGKGKASVEWRGGWYLYALPFQYALKPSKDLLRNVDLSDEHWLVSYNQHTQVYFPQQVGKFFYRTVNQQGHGTSRKIVIEIILEITCDVPVPFGPNEKLKKGYWRIVVTGLHDVKHHDQVRIDSKRELTYGEYLALKTPSADLLSFREPPTRTYEW